MDIDDDDNDDDDDDNDDDDGDDDDDDDNAIKDQGVINCWWMMNFWSWILWTERIDQWTSDVSCYTFSHFLDNFDQFLASWVNMYTSNSLKLYSCFKFYLYETPSKIFPKLK